MGNAKRGHNEGSIRERKDGRFEVRVTAGIDFSTGKPKRISYYAKTRAEATKILHEEEYKIHFQEHVDPTSVTFVDWLRLWLETYMKNSLKQSTYTSYKGYIENHIAVAFPTLKLKDLTSKLLQDFYNYKLTKEGLSPKTIANIHRCLHKALKQAVLEHHLNFNPCDAVTLPRNEKPQIEILTREEQERLIYTSYNFRYGVFIRLTLATGIHVLDSQKHEEMKLMEDLFSMPTVPKNQSYPVIVTPSPNGFILNAVDFEELKIEADNIQYGINCIQSAIAQKLSNIYPPSPTPNSELVLNIGEFVVMVNI